MTLCGWGDVLDDQGGTDTFTVLLIRGLTMSSVQPREPSSGEPVLLPTPLPRVRAEREQAEIVDGRTFLERQGERRRETERKLALHMHDYRLARSPASLE
jgi:hypothetical protein